MKDFDRFSQKIWELILQHSAQAYGDILHLVHRRAVGRSENLGVPVVVFGGHNLPPPPSVEIRLTDLPKSGGAMAPPAPLRTTPLL